MFLSIQFCSTRDGIWRTSSHHLDGLDDVGVGRPREVPRGDDVDPQWHGHGARPAQAALPREAGHRDAGRCRASSSAVAVVPAAAAVLRSLVVSISAVIGAGVGILVVPGRLPSLALPLQL